MIKEILWWQTEWNILQISQETPDWTDCLALEQLSLMVGRITSLQKEKIASRIRQHILIEIKQLCHKKAHIFAPGAISLSKMTTTPYSQYGAKTICPPLACCLLHLHLGPCHSAQYHELHQFCCNLGNKSRKPLYVPLLTLQLSQMASENNGMYDSEMDVHTSKREWRSSSSLTASAICLVLSTVLSRPSKSSSCSVLPKQLLGHKSFKLFYFSITLWHFQSTLEQGNTIWKQAPKFHNNFCLKSHNFTTSIMETAQKHENSRSTTKVLPSEEYHHVTVFETTQSCRH